MVLAPQHFLRNDNGAMEFHFCNFRVNNNPGQAKKVNMFYNASPHSDWKFFNCTISGENDAQPATTGVYRGVGQSLMYVIDNIGFSSTEQPGAGNMMQKVKGMLGTFTATGSNLTTSVVSNDTFIKVE